MLLYYYYYYFKIEKRTALRFCTIKWAGYTILAICFVAIIVSTSALKLTCKFQTMMCDMLINDDK